MNDEALPLQAMIVAVTPFQQNCAILWCTRTMKAAVIDPGGDVDNILKAIEETGASPQTILLTHGHIDHAGGAAELKRALSVEIVGPHREDQWLLDSLPATGAQYGIKAEPCSPDRWLAEGDAVNVGDVSFEVLHCPGHTPGHIVFVNREIKFGIFGDVLFRGSIGRTDFPRGDHGALIASINYKLLPLGDEFMFICGHGPGSSIGHERRTNPFLR